MEQEKLLENMELAVSNDRIGIFSCFFKNRSPEMQDLTGKNRLGERGSFDWKTQKTKREKNIIIFGLKQNYTNRDEVKKFLIDKLQTTTIQEDIVYILKLTKEGGQNTICRVRMVFANKEMKPTVMKKKQQLVGQSVWIIRWQNIP